MTTVAYFSINRCKGQIFMHNTLERYIFLVKANQFPLFNAPMQL